MMLILSRYQIGGLFEEAAGEGIGGVGNGRYPPQCQQREVIQQQGGLASEGMVRGDGRWQPAHKQFPHHQENQQNLIQKRVTAFTKSCRL